MNPYAIQRLLRKRGQTYTLSRRDQGTYDTAAGGAANGTPTTQEIQGHFQFNRRAERDGAERGDRLLLIGPKHRGHALSVTPRAGDRVTGEGDEVRINSVRRVYSGTKLLAYVCEVTE